MHHDLVEYSSEQTIVCISGVISFIAKFILSLVVFKQLMLCGNWKKIQDFYTQLKSLNLEHFIKVIKEYWETTGVQCACNLLFVLCWSRITKTSIWQMMHSQDETTLFVPNGKSVLLKLKDLFQLEKYTQVAHLQYRDRTQQFFKAS